MHGVMSKWGGPQKTCLQLKIWLKTGIFYEKQLQRRRNPAEDAQRGLWGSDHEISHYYKLLNLKTAPQAALKNPFWARNGRFKRCKRQTARGRKPEVGGRRAEVGSQKNKFEIRNKYKNFKFEIRSTKFETNSNVQNSNDQNKHAMAILVDFFWGFLFRMLSKVSLKPLCWRNPDSSGLIPSFLTWSGIHVHRDETTEVLPERG